MKLSEIKSELSAAQSNIQNHHNRMSSQNPHHHHQDDANEGIFLEAAYNGINEGGGLILKSSSISKTNENNSQRINSTATTCSQRLKQNINWSDKIYIDNNRKSSASHQQTSVSPLNELQMSPSTDSVPKLARIIVNAKRRNFLSNGRLGQTPSPGNTPITTPTMNSIYNIHQYTYTAQQQNPSSSHNQGLQRTDINCEFLGELERVLTKQFSPLVHNIMTKIDFNEKKRLEKKKLEEIADEWSDVARIFDKILCYFFLIFTLVSSFSIFLISPHFWSGR